MSNIFRFELLHIAADAKERYGTMSNEVIPILAVSAGEIILRLPQVKSRTGLSRSSIYAGAKAGTFPTPIKLGERAVGWMASSIDAWMLTRLATTQRKGVL
ncbi:AlpA family transcriptional regulator [Massilia sp. TS11]|uniref:helix-turn-helix transcriptional regulator n=1 Tax=Massilia sp. TS11 TaxID=2908003 RepID=UPI001EDC0C1E|nr:AlpA family transcriptional regulator [Massilia sp. TS11]MCG2585983.1 AlpA family transcriptional regulator [Massilia sp. TS11]